MPKKGSPSTGVGLKKRQAIDKANRTMFLWIAAASVALAILIVAVQFMYGQMVFNNKVLAKQQETEATLKTNLQNVAKLKVNINPLNVGTADVSSKKVLAALPVERDSSAFGAAIQKIVAPASGVQIQSFTFEDVEAVVGDNGTTSQSSSTSSSTKSTTTGNAKPVTSTLVVTGTYAQITDFLKNLERVLRPISIETINLTGSGTNMSLNLKMATYYQPKKTIEVITKVVTP